ncbi:hypothetical protein PF006_g33376 [Phytophthora fragariae]|uniref:Uncharacterized protein n=1 Tax=Phytophthora fragariae TaxID=53985 RepID=A0A6A3PLX3_9STRA|nr:hypothetical protein PF006_g33376 [Phytophthora fragariae]
MRASAACPIPAATAIACSAANGRALSLSPAVLANPLIAFPASSYLGPTSLPPNPRPNCFQLIRSATSGLASLFFGGAVPASFVSALPLR